jgi:hypothetical protein
MTVGPMPKKKPETAVAKPHVPTNREVSAQKAYRKRQAASRPVPPIKVSMSQREDGARVASIMVSHPDQTLAFELLAEATASESQAFLTGTLDALGMVAQRGGVVDEGQMNYAVSMVSGIRPRDQLEATLAVQMAAIHMATMSAAANMSGAKTNEVREMYEKAMNRLARTFVAQVEGLKRYRSKGEQRVIVERVTVEKGGQAIVGNVAHGGGADQENDR